MTRAHCCYSGRVQGVGFRATCMLIARDFPVRGWVRNLRDGRVELVAEGEAAVVASYLAAVDARFRAHVTRRERHDSDDAGEEPGFHIRY